MHWVEDNAAAVKMRPKIPELLVSADLPHFISIHALNHQCTTQKCGETQEGSLRQTGSVRGHKTEILYRRMSGANKSYLRRFAGLCALTVKTANRTAASEHPTGHREANNIGNSLR